MSTLPFLTLEQFTYVDTKVNIEALTGLVGGERGYATDTGEKGHYDAINVIWVWGGGGGTVESVTGDGVDITDPANPVISYPTPGDIGAASAAQGALADTALQPADVGSAAYEDTSAFDANGAATTAEANAKSYADGLVITWAVISADQTIVVNHGYICNKASLLTLTLPVTAAVNTIVEISGMNAGLWKVAQNSGQIIHFGDADTTTGATGYIASTHARDAVRMICCVANTEWNVLSAQGNITVA